MLPPEFRAAVRTAVELYEHENRRAATRTRLMIADRGEVDALSRLMLSPDLQQGFKVLRDSNRLAQTFESVVIRFQGLFTPEVVAAAQWRLDHADELL